MFDENENLIRNIKYYCRLQNITCSDLAIYSDLSYSTIRNVLHLRTRFVMSTLFKISKGLEIPFHFLFINNTNYINLIDSIYVNLPAIEKRNNALFKKIEKVYDSKGENLAEELDSETIKTLFILSEDPLIIPPIIHNKSNSDNVIQTFSGNC